jgi:hypothetical protein
MPEVPPEVVSAAWARVVYDCGCPDLYYCPQSHNIECPRHGGFDTCCARPDEHVLAPNCRGVRWETVARVIST